VSRKYLLNFSSQFLSNTISQLLALAVIPYSARIFGPSKFGEYNLANSFSVYATMFASLGFGYYIAREVPRRGDFKSIVNLAVTLKILFSIVVSIIAIVSITVFAVKVSPDFFWINLVFIISLLLSVFDLRWLFIAKDLMWKISLLNLIGQIISASLIFIFIHRYNNLILFTCIQCIIVIIPSIVSYWLYWKEYGKIQLTLKFNKWKELTRESINFGVISILATLNVYIGTLWIGYLLSTNEVGIYSAGFKIMMFFNMVFNLFSSVIIPTISRLFKENKEKLLSFLNIYFYLSLLLGIVSSITLYFLAIPVINTLFGPLYVKSSPLLKIWAIGMLPFTPLSIFSMSTLMSTNGSKPAFRMMLISSLILLIVIPFSMKNFGLAGVPIGQSIMEFLTAIISFSLLKKELKLNKVAVMELVNVKKAFRFSMEYKKQLM
jgi:O-antigen/teichoic acid export membrane protein